MLDLPGGLIEAKNSLADTSVWVLLAQVEYDTSVYQRFAANAVEDITWNSQTWTALPIEFEPIKESREELPNLSARICNISRQVQAQLETYDGAVDAPVDLYIVHTGNLSETSVPHFSFNITHAKCDALWAYLTLGIFIYVMRAQDPQDVMMKNFCRFGYPHSNDARCPYTGGTYEFCNKTLADCQQRNGSLAYRFGAFPAIGLNRIYV